MNRAKWRRAPALLVLSSCLALVALALYPRQVAISPGWRVRVLDEAGRPVPGLRVVQWWVHYSVDRVPRYEQRVTNVQGIVLFPARVVRLRLMGEVSGAVAAVARTGINASFGSDAWLVIADPRAPVVTREHARTRNGELISEVVLRAAPSSTGAVR